MIVQSLKQVLNFLKQFLELCVLHPLKDLKAISRLEMLINSYELVVMLWELKNRP